MQRENDFSACKPLAARLRNRKSIIFKHSANVPEAN